MQYFTEAAIRQVGTWTPTNRQEVLRQAMERRENEAADRATQERPETRTR